MPEEGSNIYFDSIVITATSSKKEMAEQFIDFLPCTLVHALFTERAGVVVELAGSRVGERPGGGLGEEPGGYGKRRRKQCGSEQI